MTGQPVSGPSIPRDAHPETLEALDARVSMLRNECGCDAGSIATLGAVGIYALALLLTGWFADWSVGRVVSVGALLAFVAGATAKLARIWFARRQADALAHRREDLAQAEGSSAPLPYL